MATIVITNEPGQANFVVSNQSGAANDDVVTNEPERMYNNLSHEQMRNGARISWTTPVTDKIYQFCAANGISCHALPAPELGHELMIYIGFMTADTVVFQHAFEKTLSYIKRYITADGMKGMLEEQSITGKKGSDWNCRFKVWPTTWQSCAYSVGESGFAAPLGADMEWMAMRRCPARSLEACVSAAVALLRKKGAASKSGNVGSAPMTPPTTPRKSGSSSTGNVGSAPMTPPASTPAPASVPSASVPIIVTKQVNSAFHIKFAEMLRAGNPSSTEADLDAYLNTPEAFSQVRDIFQNSIENETALQESSRELAEKDAQIARLRSMNGHDEAALQDSTRKLAAKDAEIARLRESNAELENYTKECELYTSKYDELVKRLEEMRAKFELSRKELASEKSVNEGLRARCEVLEGHASNSASTSSGSGFLPKWTGSILGRSQPTTSTDSAPAAKKSPIQMSFIPSPTPFINTGSGTRANPISLNFSSANSNKKLPAAPKEVHFNAPENESESIYGGGSSYYGADEAAEAIKAMDRGLADLGIEV